ncbi:hypothetical protein CIHG_00044 [Coccidioides immitis H538.4]|uniref:Uncharacterized protein n=1 Tax=Coccidioides immitis H538.4 TaxID=396776 RepID=A0A0J8RE91_COCIT|nr:hypothetical protein CIHG_00044 [Coccidioides immitis H538.4]
MSANCGLHGSCRRVEGWDPRSGCRSPPGPSSAHHVLGADQPPTSTKKHAGRLTDSTLNNALLLSTILLDCSRKAGDLLLAIKYFNLSVKASACCLLNKYKQPVGLLSVFAIMKEESSDGFASVSHFWASLDMRYIHIPGFRCSLFNDEDARSSSCPIAFRSSPELFTVRKPRNIVLVPLFSGDALSGFLCRATLSSYLSTYAGPKHVGPGDAIKDARYLRRVHEKEAATIVAEWVQDNGDRTRPT